MNQQYQPVNAASSASFPNYNSHQGPYPFDNNAAYTPPRKSSNKRWLKIGIPIAILVIAGAVVGVIFGLRSKKNSSSSASSSGGSGGSSGSGGQNNIGIFPTATNSEFMVPLYPATTNTALYTNPTFDVALASKARPTDTFAPATPSVLSVRPDRPRLIAPPYQWQALPTLIKNDPYLSSWNDTIFGNATDYYNADPVAYFMDGSSGILDVARQVKERVKAWGYAYRLTNDTKWVDRTYRELQNAAGWGTPPDRWNSAHFLDTAELSAAYGIAYDWMYDMWTSDQKTFIMSSLLDFGLSFGVNALQGNLSIGWWSVNTTGNWNCVCNNGLTMGALAILGDDTTNNATTLLGLTVDNAKTNCTQAVNADGTWAETANYWYFGTTGIAEMSSSLISATGSDYGLSTVNPSMAQSGLFHMYAYGTTSLFNYGDHGPNKYSSTANSMFLHSTQYNMPQYALFQRDRPDAADPWSMFWYDPQVQGAYWDGMALDMFFNNFLDQWASMRSSWTDMDAVYVAVKAGVVDPNQVHNDLDIGDFVLDALGTRWAGELGSADYNSPGYFTSVAQDGFRWQYYRKMTEGQNTIMVNSSNQLLTARPQILSNGTTGEIQGSSTVFNLPGTSTAFWTADLSSAYANGVNWQRGVRMINGRKQVLVQDEITSPFPFMWRMHTNATVNIDSSGTSTTLTLDGQTMKVNILNAQSGISFSQSNATRLPTDPVPQEADQANPGVTVLIISAQPGTYSLQVLFTPQYSDGSAASFPTVPSVQLSSWSLTSHNSS